MLSRCIRSLENQEVIPLILEIEIVLRANRANPRRARMEGMTRPQVEVEDAKIRQAQ